MNNETFFHNDPGISEEDWQQTPPSVRALVGALQTRLQKIEE